ncbi:MAG TPA: AsmA family protein [Desulfobacteraceae bacterium]|nr:AsmA family protein [Desulfobacteraceae bacterium]
MAVVLALLVRVLVDSEALRHRIEQTVSRATDMEVNVEGQVTIRLFPVPGVRLEDLRIRNGRDEWLTAAALNLRIRVPALLAGRVEPAVINLVEPKLQLRRNADGSYNFIPARRPDASGAGQAGAIRHFRVTAAALSFIDQSSGEQFTAEGCYWEGRNLEWRPAQPPHSGPNLPDFHGLLSCRKVTYGVLEATELQARVASSDRQLEISPVTGLLLDGRLQGQLESDFSGPAPAHSLEAELVDFHIKRFFETFQLERGMRGSATFAIQLNFSGKTVSEMVASLQGRSTLSGTELVVHGQDLDKQLARYQDTQRFNLVDTVTLFAAGPIGLAITRGYGFATLFVDTGEQTHIRELFSEWDIVNGIARASDVALSTAENRLALAGELDFVNSRFRDMRVAVVDAKGCAIVEQRIHGTFREPEVESPHFLATLTGPFIDIVNRGISLFAEQECEPFYTGRVPSP